MNLPRKTAQQKLRAQELLAEFYHFYPNPHCELNHSNAFELLIATILSAQCTDVRVNMVTASLFKKYSSPQAFANAEIPELEEDVRSTGFYRNKAKSIKETGRLIMENFGGEVPKTMDELLTLRGAARKTANVVLGNAFGINVGVVVDTHVGRISKRLGLTKHTDPIKVEKDLMALFPQEEWTNLSHLMIHHGRGPCKARISKPAHHPICERFGMDCSCKNKS